MVPRHRDPDLGLAESATMWGNLMTEVVGDEEAAECNLQPLRV